MIVHKLYQKNHKNLLYRFSKKNNYGSTLLSFALVLGKQEFSKNYKTQYSNVFMIPSFQIKNSEAATRGVL